MLEIMLVLIVLQAKILFFKLHANQAALHSELQKFCFYATQSRLIRDTSHVNQFWNSNLPLKSGVPTDSLQVIVVQLLIFAVAFYFM